jgi:hypothetical protein
MSERAVVVPDRMLNGDVSLLVIPPCALDLTPFLCGWRAQACQLTRGNAEWARSEEADASFASTPLLVPDRMLNGDVSLLVIPPCALDLTPFPCDNSAPTSPLC